MSSSSILSCWHADPRGLENELVGVLMGGFLASCIDSIGFSWALGFRSFLD